MLRTSIQHTNPTSSALPPAVLQNGRFATDTEGPEFMPLRISDSEETCTLVGQVGNLQRVGNPP